MYTANFELISDDPAEKIVTVTYKASEGGSVTLDTEHVNSGDPEFTCKGAEAKAADGYEFVNWTDAEGEEVSAESVFIPVLKANEDGTYSDAAYTANFKKQTVKITYEISPKNSATIEGKEEIAKGEDTSFIVIPGSKYTISGVKVSGEALTSVSDENEKNKEYELKNVTEDITVMITMETRVAHPEFHDKAVVNGVTITLDAEEGVLPEGVTMKAREVTGQVADDVRDAENDEDATVIAYDITLYDTDGEVLANDEWNENGSVTVNFSGDRISKASEDADRVDVLHVDDNGNVSDPLKTVSVEGEKAVDSVEFNAEHFSNVI